MKNKLTALFLILVVSILIGTSGELFSYAETLTDTAYPKLVGISVSPSTVNPNSELTVKISASDDTGIKSVNLKITGPSTSETNQIVSKIISADSDGNWSTNVLIPASAENGTWEIKTVVLADNSGKIKEYAYGTDITTNFIVAGDVKTNCTGRTTLDTQNKNNCNWSNGAWNSLTCTCTCPTNYYLGGGGSCTYMTSSTGTSATSTATTNTTTTTNSTATTTNSNTVTTTDDTTTVATNCSTSLGLNTQNKNNCNWSSGTWNEFTCTCTCPTNYYLGGGGSCTYDNNPTVVCDSNTSSSCTSSGGSWSATACACTCPANYILSDGKCISDVASIPSCSSEDYSEWSVCQSDGTQTRTILIDCTSTLPTVQNCTYYATTNCSNSGAGSTECYNSGGSWSVTSCSCTCPSTYKLDGNKCVINICGTGTGSTDCSGSGGTWNSTTCKCSCPSGYTLSGTKCILSGSCTNSSTLNTQNKNNCTWSNGTWNSTTCTCTCPTNYYLGGGGSCVYKTITTCTGTGSADCPNSNGTWNSTTCTCTCPANYTLNGTKCEANLSLTCTKDQWTCDNWSVCVSGKQYRPCTLSFDCPGVTEVSPRTEQDCTVASGTEETAEATSCYYKLSDYGDCINGVKTRKVLSSYPEGCIDNLTEPLEKTCTSAVCSYKYSTWGECKNGKRTRDVTSTTPNGCTPGNPIIEETCKSVCNDNDWKCEDWSECASEGTQYRKCSLSDTCISSTASVLKSPQTTRTCLYTKEEQATTETTVETEEVLPTECLKVGFDNKNDCEMYLYQSRIVSDCQSSGLTTQDQCREYLLSKYGKPLKCQSLSENECNSLINNVILSDLSSVISSETKDSLNEVAGMSAVIDTQAKTITVSIKKTPIAGGNTTEQIKEIKVDSLPITSSDSEQVSVNLVSVGSTSSQQQSLSPVAITFDSDQNGISDDLDSRLGDEGLTAAVKESLTGVDKAIVDGKTLEQPKYAEVTASASLVVSSVATVKTEDNKSNLKFEGKAEPNQIVTLFIYSTMPIVVTVQADANGNWTYELDKTMVDGTHEVYVAINNDEGAIVEASLPTPFFIQEAQAVSVDDFVATTGDATEVSGQTNTMMMLYVFSGIAIILILIAAFLIIKQRMSDE